MASTAQPLPFFGRAWHVAVDTSDGEHLVVASSQFEEALRATFVIEMYPQKIYWQAIVTIYNLASETASRIRAGAPDFATIWKQRDTRIELGNAVTVSAGYQSDANGKFDPGANVLYRGQVLQPVWTRENVVDYKLILRLVTGLVENTLNSVSISIEKGATDYDAVKQICGQAGTPIAIENIDAGARERLSRAKYSRGQVFHGRPYEPIGEIMRQNNLFYWVSPNGLNVRSFDPKSPPKDPDYAYGPPDLPGSYTTGGTKQGLVKRTLIGVPEQTQDGVVFRVLLDPQVRIGDVVQLAAGTVIQAHPFQYGQLPPIPSVDGLYVVAGIRHVGDTRGRGNDWYTEVVAVNAVAFPDILLRGR